MNDERSTESGDFAQLEGQLQSVRPAEVPDFVQARLQFELGRMQGRKEARKAMFAYASAACLAVWAGTTWLERSKSAVSNGAVVRTDSGESGSNSKSSGEPVSPKTWTVDEIRSLARYEAAVRGDGRFADPQESRTDSQNDNDRNEPENTEGPWNRQRWMQELLAEPATASG
ncbi:hypothetical protein GC170_10400 [bacterium]|nr:hypothetical protein [bacterium]